MSASTSVAFDQVNRALFTSVSDDFLFWFPMYDRMRDWLMGFVGPWLGFRVEDAKALARSCSYGSRCFD